MTNINEEIVAQYYEIQGYFVRRNLPFRREDRIKESDIDILAYDPETGDRLIVEVKGMFQLPLTPSNLRDRGGFDRLFPRKAIKKAKEYFGKGGKIKRVFVWSHKGCEDSTEKAERMLKEEKGVNQILYFKHDILPVLIDEIDDDKNKDRSYSGIQQLIRILLKYEFIKNDIAEDY